MLFLHLLVFALASLKERNSFSLLVNKLLELVLLFLRLIPVLLEFVEFPLVVKKALFQFSELCLFSCKLLLFTLVLSLLIHSLFFQILDLVGKLQFLGIKLILLLLVSVRMADFSKLLQLLDFRLELCKSIER